MGLSTVVLRIRADDHEGLVFGNLTEDAALVVVARCGHTPQHEKYGCSKDGSEHLHVRGELHVARVLAS